MTDNSPATDEEILRMATEALKAASRIRAETAKNSGEVVAWRRTSISSYGPMPNELTEDAHLVELWKGHPHTTSITKLYATPANSRADAIGAAATNLCDQVDHCLVGYSIDRMNISGAIAELAKCSKALRALLQQEGE